VTLVAGELYCCEKPLASPDSGLHWKLWTWQ